MTYEFYTRQDTLIAPWDLDGAYAGERERAFLPSELRPMSA